MLSLPPFQNRSELRTADFTFAECAVYSWNVYTVSLLDIYMFLSYSTNSFLVQDYL